MSTQQQQQQQQQSTVSSVAPVVEEQTPATCPICLEDFAPQPQDEPNKSNVRENVDPEEALTPNDDNNEHTVLLFALTCRHSFCVACLVTHVGHAVETKRIPLTCPEIGCHAEIADDTLVRLLDHCDTTTVEQLHRLHELACSPKGQKVPCTACPALVETADRNQVDLTCPACQHSFCRNHGDIHASLTCEAFLQTEQGRLLRQSEEALHRFTKPCSRCGALLQKANGCDYVICGHCKKDMCYRCGTHEYLQGETFRRCTECRSTYHNEVRLPMALGCIFLIFLGAFTVTLVVVWPVVCIVFVLASGCCGCFFRCGQRLDSSKQKQQARKRRQASQTNNVDIEPLQPPPPPPYQPGRGILAVVVIVFLPLAMLLDGAIMMVRGTEEGFLDTLLPELSAKAEEIPALELTSTPRTMTADDENEDNHLSSGDNNTQDEEEVPDLEKGFVLSESSNDDDDNDQRVPPAAAE